MGSCLLWIKWHNSYRNTQFLIIVYCRIFYKNNHLNVHTQNPLFWQSGFRNLTTRRYDSYFLIRLFFSPTVFPTKPFPYWLRLSYLCDWLTAVILLCSPTPTGTSGSGQTTLQRVCVCINMYMWKLRSLFSWPVMCDKRATATSLVVISLEDGTQEAHSCWLDWK